MVGIPNIKANVFNIKHFITEKLNITLTKTLTSGMNELLVLLNSTEIVRTIIIPHQYTIAHFIYV